ncbi:hypothetical protein Tsp_10752, partial [Trichinella spiralis]|uniref:hypothetical protein n=1 Tax=Trichinella spiralis TaxID=6334 RepID=UPI0001EFD30C
MRSKCAITKISTHFAHCRNGLHHQLRARSYSCVGLIALPSIGLEICVASLITGPETTPVADEKPLNLSLRAQRTTTPLLAYQTKQTKHHHQQQQQQPEVTTTTNDDKEASNLLAFVQPEGQRITQTMQQARLVPSYGCELVSPTETRMSDSVHTAVLLITCLECIIENFSPFVITLINTSSQSTTIMPLSLVTSGFRESVKGNITTSLKRRKLW